MATPGNLDWLFHSVGVVLGAAGAAILLLALFRDRSRGRRRCPRCWYDMAGTPGLRCPECGHAARSERRLFATRRRWKRAAMAIALAIAGACVGSIPAYRAGWQTLLPTAVLAAIAPAEDPTPSRALAAAGLSRPGNAVAPVPVLSGIPGVGRFFTSPSRTPGETMTDEMWERIAQGRAAGWEGRLFVRRYLSAHPHNFAAAVELPRRWPVGVALPVRLGDLQPAAFAQANIAATVRLQGGTASAASQVGESLDPVTAIADRVPVVVELRHSGAVLYREAFEVPCEIRPDDERFLDRVGGEPIDSRIREALSPQPAWGPTRHGTFITRDRTNAAKWNLLDLGISFEIELRQGADVLARGRGAAEWNRPVWKDWEDIEPQWSPDGLERTIATGAAYTGLMFRVRGDPDEAHRQYLLWPWGKRPACWMGEFETAVVSPR